MVWVSFFEERVIDHQRSIGEERTLDDKLAIGQERMVNDKWTIDRRQTSDQILRKILNDRSIYVKHAIKC